MPDAGAEISRFLLQSSPLLLVYLAGIVACIVCWRRAPRAAGCALVGLLILLLGHLGIVAMMSIVHGANRDGNAAAVRSMLNSLVILRSLGYAVGTAVLLVAVFIDRVPRRFSEEERSPAT